ALAHSTKLKDEQEYMRLQPELMQLIEDRSALATGRELPTRSKARTGEPTLPAAGSSAAEIEAFHKKVGMPPASHIDYPDLPDDGRPAEQMAEDSHLWLRALPKLHKAGITLKQATALGEILREAEADSIAYRAEAAAQRHRDSERALKRLYGPGYGTEVAKANQYLRR